VFGIDGQITAGAGFGEPRQLQERTASSVQDHPLDFLRLAIDAVAIAGGEEYLGRAGCGTQLVFGGAHQVRVGGARRPV
jgi:hypothetical protein